MASGSVLCEADVAYGDWEAAGIRILAWVQAVLKSENQEVFPYKLREDSHKTLNWATE